MNETLQFPLALLAFGADVKDRMDVIISTAIVQSGLLRATRLTPEQIEAEIGELPKRKDFLAVQLGAAYCGLTSGSDLAATVAELQAAGVFIPRLEFVGNGAYRIALCWPQPERKP